VKGLRPTPGDEGRFEDEMRALCRVENLDEHLIHVVSLDSVPEERDENEVVAQNVGDPTADTRAGEPFGDVQHDQ